MPPSLLDLAAVIAQSMGALHQIERSNGTQLHPYAGIALENVRKVLSQLQGLHAAHPAVSVATESVASSLSLVHALNQLATAGAPLAAPPPPQAPIAPPQQAAPIPLVHQASSSQPAYPAYAPPAGAPSYLQQQPAGYPQPAPAFPQPAPAFPQQAPAFPQQAAQPAPYPQAAYHAPTQPQTAVFQPPSQPVQQPAPAYAYTPPPAPPHVQQQSASHSAAAHPGAGAHSPSGSSSGELPVVSADLGAHSASNFYKGLSGNDIIDHGGLFVQTYMIPKLGTPVRLKVSLPGGYEFEANGIVRWAREQSDGSDAPPGFGAQFTQITQEARQLVYRYVRNREPLFHDDL
ncbi:PilZ domain-containing protein [Pendulispora albinea]|uniref:PilZ domain-containing protein n=1 Tax=Pendulispora albinea TaxID=2741071 RepID=A0ABZ2LUV6_9BACT